MRVYDRNMGAWRVSYFEPQRGEYAHLVATAHKRDGIRQDGTRNDGLLIRWNFSKITEPATSGRASSPKTREPPGCSTSTTRASGSASPCDAPLQGEREAQVLGVVAQRGQRRRGTLQGGEGQPHRLRAEADARDAEVGETLQRDAAESPMVEMRPFTSSMARFTRSSSFNPRKKITSAPASR